MLASRLIAGRSYTPRWRDSSAEPRHVDAIAAIVVGVFSTWLTDGPVTLNGTQGPNNGWLVVLIAPCRPSPGRE